MVLWRQVEEIVGMRSLNTGAPIRREPGQVIGLTELSISYQGPARQLAVAWAIKPTPTMASFNDGQYIVRMSWAPLVVEAQDTPTVLVAKWPGLTARIAMPTPGNFTSKGNVLASRNPVTVQINWGTFDTWVWIVDRTLMLAEGGSDTSDWLTLEKYILARDTDADVGEIVQPAAPPPAQPGVTNLLVRYAPLLT